MNERITRADVERAFAIYADTMNKHFGIKLGLDYRYTGQTIRLYEQIEGSSGHGSVQIGDAYAGSTTREAYENIIDRNHIVLDVLRLVGKS